VDGSQLPIHLEPAAVREHHVRRGGTRELRAEVVGGQDVVVVEEGDPLAVRLPRRRISGSRRPLRLIVAQRGDPLVLDSAEHLRGVVGGCLVDDDRLDIHIALRQGAAQRLLQHRGAIARREHDADLRRGHAIRHH